jgi:acyl carrier protein
MRELVFTIVSNVMEVPVEHVAEDSSPDSIANWDSLKHMNLILALENEFEVMFSDEQIIELNTVRKIIAALEELVAEAKRN